MNQLTAVAPVMVGVDAIYPSPVNKCTGQRSNVDDLIKSIAAQGLLQPPIVRKHPTTENAYELVIGERRWRACSSIVDEMPVFIHDLTDVEAHEKTITENMQREDLSPLEEAESIQVLISDGLSVEEIADRLGKDVKWIARRSKLSNLIPEIIAVYNDPDSQSGIRSWTGAHFELLARFDQNIQRIYFDNIVDDPCVKPLRELKDDMNSFLMHLSSAPWKLNDTDLCPSAGACSDCTKRTSLQTNLFDQEEIKGKIVDKCIDAECWKEKSRSFVLKRESELREKNPSLIIVNRNKHRGIFDRDDHFVRDALDGYAVAECKKTDPDAELALVVDGNDLGRVKWVKTLFGKGNTKQSGPKSLDERREGLSKRRRKRVIDLVIGILVSERQNPSIITKLDQIKQLSMAIIWGSRRYETVIDDPDYDMFDDWKNYKTFTGCFDVESMPVELARCVLPSWIDILEYIKKSDSVDLDAVRSYTDYLSIDLDEICRKVELEIKEPKSWQKEDSATANTKSDLEPEQSQVSNKKPKKAKKTKTKKTSSKKCLRDLVDVELKK